MISLNQMKIYILFILALIVISPVTGLAQGGYIDPATGINTTTGEFVNYADTCSLVEGLGRLICQVHRILNSIIPVIIALGVVYFVWGVVHYMIAGGDEAKKKGRDQIIYGLIGLAVISGLWGLVNIITNTFGLGGNAPALVSLQVTGAGGSTCTLAGDPKLQDLLCYLTRIINDSVIPLVFAIAVVIFVWGVVHYVINSSEEAKKEKGRQFMLWGIIALAVMVSVWGLVGILTATFGIDGSVLPQVKP